MNIIQGMTSWRLRCELDADDNDYDVDDNSINTNQSYHWELREAKYASKMNTISILIIEKAMASTKYACKK
jgi:hypothetical protein